MRATSPSTWAFPITSSTSSSASKQQVVKPFVDEYLAGRTPIPCTLCNNFIKFDQFLDMAEGVGADTIATGHYARIACEPARPAATKCARASIRAKDQTYFLFGLKQEQLARTLFPAGRMHQAAGARTGARAGHSGGREARQPGDLLRPQRRLRGLHRRVFSRAGHRAAETRAARSSTPMAACWASMRACIISPSASGAGLRVAAGEPLYVIATKPAAAAGRGRPQRRSAARHADRQGRQLDLHRCHPGAHARAGEDPQQAPGRRTRRSIPLPIRCAWKYTSMSRSAPSRRARARSSTRAIWCWAAAGSNSAGSTKLIAYLLVRFLLWSAGLLRLRAGDVLRPACSTAPSRGCAGSRCAIWNSPIPNARAEERARIVDGVFRSIGRTDLRLRAFARTSTPATSTNGFAMKAWSTISKPKGRAAASWSPPGISAIGS